MRVTRGSAVIMSPVASLEAVRCAQAQSDRAIERDVESPGEPSREPGARQSGCDHEDDQSEWSPEAVQRVVKRHGSRVQLQRARPVAIP